MGKLPLLVLFSLLVPTIASAEAPPPPPDDAQSADAAQPPDGAPDLRPPPPPAAPPVRDRDDDQVGILQQRSGDDVGALQGSSDVYSPARGPSVAGQWVYTTQYGWVWMPYGPQYVDEGAYGARTPYQYVYTPSLGWAWCSAPWLWGWGAYPWFGPLGPDRFGWYRGLYRSGYGWGRYRGGYPGSVYRGGYSSRGYVRDSGAYHPTRPLGSGTFTRGSVPPRGGGARRTYGSTAPVRMGSFGGGRSAPGSGRSGVPHAVAPSRGGAHRGR